MKNCNIYFVDEKLNDDLLIEVVGKMKEFKPLIFETLKINTKNEKVASLEVTNNLFRKIQGCKKKLILNRNTALTVNGYKISKFSTEEPSSWSTSEFHFLQKVLQNKGVLTYNAVQNNEIEPAEIYYCAIEKQHRHIKQETWKLDHKVNGILNTKQLRQLCLENEIVVFCEVCKCVFTSDAKYSNFKPFYNSLSLKDEGNT